MSYHIISYHIISYMNVISMLISQPRNIYTSNWEPFRCRTRRQPPHRSWHNYIFGNRSDDKANASVSSQSIHFLSRKCGWKCLLRSGSKFASASICYNLVPTHFIDINLVTYHVTGNSTSHSTLIQPSDKSDIRNSLISDLKFRLNCKNKDILGSVR